MNTSFAKTLSIAALIAALLPCAALARKGELDRPHVALHTSIPENHRKQILRALKRKDCTFVSGTWVNSFTRLHYRSDAKALQGFIDELSKCPDIKVTLGFISKKESSGWMPTESNWSVFHMPVDGNTFIVKVRLGSEIDVSKLNIPVQDRSVDSARAEQDGAEQPATAPNSKSVDSEKPKPESKGRPQ